MDVTITDSDSPVRYIFTRQPDNPSVIVADGYGVKIHVARGHLIIEDGIGETRRTRRIPRVDATQPSHRRETSTGIHVSRLVILSDTGFVTLDALRWCADLGISVTQLDRTGRILMSSPGLGGDARLRASQVHAAADGRNAATGERIYRTLLSAKVHGQADVLFEALPDCSTAVCSIHSLADRIMSPGLDATSVMPVEGNAAKLYFDAWKGRVFTPFDPADLNFVPAHWNVYESRKSLRNPRVPGGKDATSPVNAMLNYAYALCEKEARYACHVIGLDPALGFHHTAHHGSDTLVYDLVEVLRPYADRVVLSMMDTGKGIPFANGKPAYFKALWFCETRDAVCRLVAPLTHMLAERIPAAVAPVAGEYAQMIARELSETSRFKPKTPHQQHTDSLARLRTGHRSKLADDITIEDVVPDHVWETVRDLIPHVAAARAGNVTPNPRGVLAGILCHELYGVSWRNIPPVMCSDWVGHKRFTTWRASGDWKIILDAVETASKSHRGTI